MFCHSAAEGVAVGVSFDKRCDTYFGLYVTFLLALQNMPEGLAVALVLVPRGIHKPLATLIATLTSAPQPIMAVAGFRFVEQFLSFLPIGLGFAAGAMIYVSGSELVTEAVPSVGWKLSSVFIGVTFILTACIQNVLQRAVGG